MIRKGQGEVGERFDVRRQIQCINCSRWLIRPAIRNTYGKSGHSPGRTDGASGGRL